MSRATPDDQLKFLLSCVRHSNNGKIDFVEVANECGVISKGAAAKRYERLLKSNGIHPNGGPAEKPFTSTPRPKSKADIARSAAAKRRKIEGASFNYRVDDEDDPNPFMKSEPLEAAHTSIKHESDNFHSFHFQSMTAPAPPPFFPRTPITPMRISSPYPAQYPSFRQPATYAFSPPTSPYPVVAPSSHQPSQSHSTLNEAPALSNQQGIIKKEEKPVSMSEEHIQAMFDEFCSQDMFRQPNFDGPPAVNSNNATSSLTATPAINDSQISPRTTDASAITAAEIKPPGSSTAEQSSIMERPKLATSSPSGKGINDSILIID